MPRGNLYNKKSILYEYAGSGSPVEQFKNLIKGSANEEAVSWAKYRAGETGMPKGKTAIDASTSDPTIKESAKAISTRAREKAPKGISALAKYIRKPRLWQGK